MRRALALILLLAACQMQAKPADAPEGLGGIADEAISVTTLEGAPAGLPTAPSAATPDLAPPTAVAAPASGVPVLTPDATTVRPRPKPAALGGTAAARPVSAPDEGSGAGPVAPVAPVSPEQALCEKSGGAWAKVGGAGRICVKKTRDAGKACHKKSDCTGECLAQSGTCSPIAPLMGCNAVLDNEGREMTQCLQ